MALDSLLSVRLTATQTNPQALLTATAPLPREYLLRLATGTGAGQADVLHAVTMQLAASTGQDLDLSGSLGAPLGGNAVFARIKKMIVAAAATNVNNVVLGGASSNQWVGPFGAAAHTLAVAPGGVLALGRIDATGWPVAAGTGDLLRVANSGAGSVVNFDLILIGASA